MSKGRAAVLAVLAKHDVPVVSLEYRPWHPGNEIGDGLEGGWIVNGHDLGFRSARDLERFLACWPTAAAALSHPLVAESLS